MRSALRSLWIEPLAMNPPARVWRDWVLVAVLTAAVILEGILQADLVWRPVAIPLGLALVSTLLWRRTHPLAMAAPAFGSLIAFDLASLIAGEKPVELYAGAIVLLLVYSLFRWGTGRDVAIGLAIMSLALVVSLVTDFTGVGDAVGGTVILLFPAVLGLEVRYRFTARRQQMEQFKLRERERLARELHDTVAHHVSAIAVQAQAGRFLARSSSLEGAADALEVIEEEASRALAEMRSMIGILRDVDTAPDMAPQRGITDIEHLAANNAPDSPRVCVELSGELDNLKPAVDAAIYRLAQESITNAIRHARHATHIDIRVTADAETVRLAVTDNGDTTSAGSTSSGYGLVGMTERANLLGGNLKAGPGPNRGWEVHAVLPRQKKTA